MTNPHYFTTEEEKEIEEILFEAFQIEDRLEQTEFVKKKCKNNKQMCSRILSDLDFSDEISVGDEILSYTVLRKIEKPSGFASLYIAEHRVFKKLAAIKIFDKKKDTDNSIFKINEYSWRNEQKSLDSLDRSDIVKLYDGGNHKKYGFFLIIEYFNGGHHIDDPEVKVNSLLELLNIFKSLCDAIEYVHKKGIAHLDLKPDNILIVPSTNQIKLIDFSSSKKIKERLQTKTSDLIKPHSIKFASPEQLNTYEGLDHLSDIYSLGAVFYTLFTERVPFGEGEINKDKIKKLVEHSELVAPSERVLELGEKEKFGVSSKELSEILKGDLDAIIGKCLHKNKKERYQSVAAIRKDIENYLDGKVVTAKVENLKTWRDISKYKSYKFFTDFFTIKKGLPGWKKWKKPTIRFALTGIFIFLFGFFCFYVGRYLIRQIKGELNPAFSELKPKRYRVRINDEVKDDYEIKEVVTLSFDGKSYFNLLKLADKSIYMGRFEVTNTQWNLVSRMKSEQILILKKTDDNSLPKTEVSYSEVVEFCNRLSSHLSKKTSEEIKVRLPTNDEWEYACRANTKSKYGGGDKFDVDFVNSKYTFEDSKDFQTFVIKKLGSTTLPDSNFDSNPWGLAAMNGNVWEMTSENMNNNIYNLRGGSFAFLDAQCSSIIPDPSLTSPGNNQTGFRIVIEAIGLNKAIPSRSESVSK
jgi:serine/threonine protein kinase